MFLWPYERHAEVLRTWSEWTRTAREEVTTSFRIIHFPPLPELPPFLSGRSVVVIDGAYAGEVADGVEALAELRALEPEMDTWAPSSPAVLSRIHMDAEEPMPYVGDTALLGQLDDAALAAFVAPIRPGAPVMFGELRHLGGAVGRAPEGAGAAGRLEGEYLMFGAALVLDEESARACKAALARFCDALAPYATGKRYLNFAEQPADSASLYEDGSYTRLRALRAAVDPAGRMVGNHPIPAS
jgi:hypothetical protein